MSLRDLRGRTAIVGVGTAGHLAVNQAGGSMASPLRVRRRRPSQLPRTPSSFSLTQYSETSMPAA